MYFDGQLHYLDKDKPPEPSPKPPPQRQRTATTDQANSSSSTSPPQQPPAPHTSSSLSSPPPPPPPPSMSKSQTVGGPAGDLHSMALKSAISNIAPHFVKRPSLQKRMLSAASPAELLRTTLSPSDISFRAITYLPDELLYDIPETGDSALSLFQGFKASLPEASSSTALRKGSKAHSHHRKSASKTNSEPLNETQRLQRERDSLLRDLEVITIRKSLASSEISDIDAKIHKLSQLRTEFLQKLTKLEGQETNLEHEVNNIDNRLAEMQELQEIERIEEEAGIRQTTPKVEIPESMSGSFMSESVYGKLNSPQARRRRAMRRIATPVLQKHLGHGTNIRTIQAHADPLTALDFDIPFGTLVTASLDSTVRVWDLSNGRCQGLLEGHNASVRCLQIEDSIIATGSTDATIRIWDLTRAETYSSPTQPATSVISSLIHTKGDEDSDSDEATDGSQLSRPHTPQQYISTADCCVDVFDSHIGEITALHFMGGTLVSGSADKTIRVWDLNSGRCVQTIDVLTVIAQSTNSQLASWGTGRRAGTDWRSASFNSFAKGARDANEACFIGGLQCFENALATGTSDGIIRLWDLRSGQVHRTLVGHTGPVTCLQFDSLHLVTGSLDCSVRIWDIRTGAMVNSYTQPHGITSLHFDQVRIVCAAGEDVVSVYEREDERHWACGPGAAIAEETGRPGGGGSVIESVRSKESYLVEGRRDGKIGVWAC